MSTRIHQHTHPHTRALLRAAWAAEHASARGDRAKGDTASEWNHLERAHVLSQPMAAAHMRTHLSMLAYGLRRRDRREVTGQLIRLLVAGPASLTGRYPVGNTGGANISALTALPIADDLRILLGAQP